MQNGVLPLNETASELLTQKHSEASPATESVILKKFILSNLRT